MRIQTQIEVESFRQLTKIILAIYNRIYKLVKK